MTKSDTVTSYITRVSQVRDELGVISEKVEESKLVMTSLNNFSKPWDSFVHEIFGRENMPNWERLWGDFVKEDLRLGSGHTSQQQGNDEENVALSTNSKKMSKKGPKDGDKSKGEWKKDISKVKCFACHKFGHYAGQCPNS